MKRLFRGGMYAVGGLIALLALSIGGVYGVSQSHMNRVYAIETPALTLPTDSASLAFGRHQSIIRGCADCHGADLGGRVFIEDPMMGRLVASNLTAGAGGVGAAYDVADWDRAIRHGIGPDGKALLFMPSHEFNRMSDEDTAALIAFLRSAPAVDNELPGNSVRPLARALYLSGQLPLLPAAFIDHDLRDRVAPPRAATAEYGAYLAPSCMGCHGEGFSGGRIPGVPPDWPHSTNLTPDIETGIGSWTEQDFVTALRTGVRPDGTHLQEPYMPWSLTAAMTDEELGALWAYFRSLPATPQGNR